MVARSNVEKVSFSAISVQAYIAGKLENIGKPCDEEWELARHCILAKSRHTKKAWTECHLAVRGLVANMPAFLQTVALDQG